MTGPSSRLVQLVAILVVLAALPVSAEAQQNIRFRHISLNEGLSQAAVNVIHQDRQGFIWFGTHEGLNRFDGYEFVVYQYDPADPTSLSHDTVRAITETADGIMWIGTDNGGLDRFNRADGTFLQFRHDPEDPESLSSNRVRVIYEDTRGFLWIGTDGGGLNRFDRRSGVFERFLPQPEDPSSLSHSHVRTIVEDEAGHLWIGTDGGGLNIFDPARGSFDHFRHDAADKTSLSDDRVLELFQDNGGALWIGTEKGGLNRFDRQSGGFVRYSQQAGLGRGAVRSIFQTDSGALVVGTDGSGLHVWDPEELEFSAYRHDPTDSYSLSHDRVSEIYQDRSGIVWVGTFNGLNTWNPRIGNFPHFHASDGHAGRLSNNYVTSFAEGADGTIWVGTLGGGLNAFEPSTGIFRQYQHDPRKKDTLSDDRIMSLAADARGGLWIGTIGGGLNYFDPRTNRFEHYRHDPDDPASLSFNGVTAIHQDRNGSLWVATYRGGLNRLEPGSKSFFRYRHDPADPASLSSDRVVALYEDGAGDLWLGTDGGGLNRLDRSRGTFERFLNDPADLTSLSSNHAWTITEGSDGDLWVGTQGGGLNRWVRSDRETGRAVFRRYLKSSGLLSNVIYASLWDDKNHLWLSTNRGLAVLEPETGTVRHYNTSHGLQSEEFNFAAALRTRSGRMLFGGINGFNAFFPQDIKINTHVPPVRLTAVLKSNRSVTFGKPLSELEEVEVGFQDSVVTLAFAALDFTAPEKNRYRYKLEGFDEDWVDHGNRRRVTYTSLPAGQYTFRVQAANNDGVWNRDGLTLRLNCLPPPWATRRAYTLYALILAILALLYARDQARKRRAASELAATNLSLEREISRRRANEQALEDANRKAQREKVRAERYFQVADVLMVVLDTEGTVQMINAKGCEVLERNQAEIIGRNWFKRFVVEKERAALRKRFDTSRAHEYVEYPVLTKAGEERVIAWHTTYLRDESGAVTGTLSSGSDLTPLRQLEEEKQVAEEANRAKSQFLANMSHEIRTPMNGVLGMMELLLDTRMSPRQREFAEKAQTSAVSLLGIINDILDFSKIEAGRLELEDVEFDLRELVGGTVDVLATSARERDLELNVEFGADVPHLLLGDPTRIRQVLSNLIGNAIKFTNQGSVEVRVTAPEATVTTARIQFAVSDTGVGIRKKVRERIFDPFHQADGSTTRLYGGTGLGLSICKQLVEAMGGEIGVESRPGKGSTFTFWVELARQASAGIARAFGPVDKPTAAPMQSLAGISILLAEDNPINQDVVLGMLEGLGGSVDAVTNGADAITAMEKESYDLVLMDCQMPVVDGYGATREIRRLEEEGQAFASGRVPIVAMTAHAMQGERGRCMAAGMDDYLAKPFSRDDLLDIIGRWLPRRSKGSKPRRGAGAKVPEVVVLATEGEQVAAAQTGAQWSLPTVQGPPINHRAQQRYLWDGVPLEGACQVLAFYLETAAGLVATLGRAVARVDLETAAEVAHRLRSSSAMLGAENLAALCTELECAGREDSSVRVSALFRLLEREFRRVVPVLEQDLAAAKTKQASAS